MSKVAPKAAMILTEAALRQSDGLALYRPRPEQVEFHRSAASERLVKGGVRSGKTICASAEIAAAALRRPIQLWDGTKLPLRYPTNRPLLIWVIGWDERHLARIYRKLFKGGLFRIIKDKETGRWRTWKPWDAEDKARENETRQSPPMIDRRMVEKFVFHRAAMKILTAAILKNGTTIEFYSSKAEAGRGDPVDIIWIDEDIQIPAHYDEWLSRLSDTKGRLVWSAWPADANTAMLKLEERADLQRQMRRPDVQQWTLTFTGNPYIDSDEKRKRVEAWGHSGAATLAARDEGRHTFGRAMAFPEFNIERHGIPCEKLKNLRISKALGQNQYVAPESWTHYLSVDPAHQKMAAIVHSVPPPELGDYVVISDEFFFTQAGPHDLAEAILARYPRRIWRAFIMDMHAGRVRGLTGGKPVCLQYSEVFEQHKIESTLTGHGFIAGCDDIVARNMYVRECLREREDGSSRLLVLRDCTPETQREFRAYMKYISKDDVKEKYVDRDDDCMDANAYGLMYLAPLIDAGIAWVEPPIEAQIDEGYAAFLEMQKMWERKKRRDKSVYIGAGPVPELQRA